MANGSGKPQYVSTKMRWARIESLHNSNIAICEAENVSTAPVLLKKSDIPEAGLKKKSAELGRVNLLFFIWN